MAEAPPYSEQRCHRTMSQFVQSRDNIFHLVCAKRAARRRRHDPVNDGFDPHLPPGSPIRWVPRRKAAVIWAIRNETITVGDACERYGLSAEELAHWERDLDRYGIPGLRSTRVQIYRETSEPK